jgi:hypothetical protein
VEARSADYPVRLATTRPNYGGVRWWFVCPLVVRGVPCGQRAGKLHLPPGSLYFGCRACHGLTYASSQDSRKYDSLARLLSRSGDLDFETAKAALKEIARESR